MYAEAPKKVLVIGNELSFSRITLYMQTHESEYELVSCPSTRQGIHFMGGQRDDLRGFIQRECPQAAAIIIDPLEQRVLDLIQESGLGNMHIIGIVGNNPYAIVRASRVLRLHDLCEDPDLLKRTLDEFCLSATHPPAVQNQDGFN